jgi:hypothetical protein
MTTAQIVNISNYNPEEDISYAKIKINPSGGKNIAIINSKTRKTTMLSTPLMLTWGMSEFIDEKSGKKVYDLSLQFPNANYPDEAGEAFLQKMIKFEQKIKADAIVNSREWFDKPRMSNDVVEALWSPMLKYPKNKTTREIDYTMAPTFRIKIPYWDGEFKTEIYDFNKNQLWPSETASTPLEYVPKFTRIACVLQCGGIWFAAGRFGVTWKLFQAVVKPPQSLRGTCHIEVSDTDREIMANDSKAGAGAGAHSNASNEDDEDDGGYATNQSTFNTNSGASAAAADDSDGENESKQSPPLTTNTNASVVVSDEAPSSDVKRKVVVRKKKTGSD